MAEDQLTVGTVLDDIFAYMNGQGRPQPTGIGDAAGSDFPKSQTIPAVTSTATKVWEVKTTGATRATSPFNMYDFTFPINGVNGKTWYLGYNMQHFITGGIDPNGNGAVGMSFFADAADTNVGGVHALECNPANFISPSGTHATYAMEMVAVNDDTNTVNVTFRCGTGNAGGLGSAIWFQNADATKNFAKFDNAGGISLYQSTQTVGPSWSQQAAGTVTWVLASTTGAATASVTSTSGAAQFSVGSVNNTGYFIMSGNNANTLHAGLLLQKSGVNKWGIYYEDPYLIFPNYVNGGGVGHAYFVPGNTSGGDWSLSETWFLSKLKSYSSLICGNAALATNATKGFLYFPSMPGAPSGTPATETGTVPFVVNSTTGDVDYWYSGAWKTLGGAPLDSTGTDIQHVGIQSAGSSTQAARADHVHPGLAGWEPGDNGLLAATARLDNIQTISNLANGTVFYIRIDWRQDLAFSKISLPMYQVPTGTSTGTFIAYFTSAGVRAGYSGECAATLAAGTGEDFTDVSMGATINAVHGTFGFIAILINTATSPLYAYLTSTGSPYLNLGATNAAGNLRVSASSATNLTAMPSSIDPTNSSTMARSSGKAILVGVKA